jgi:hypothetical protein
MNYLISPINITLKSDDIYCDIISLMDNNNYPTLTVTEKNNGKFITAIVNPDDSHYVVVMTDGTIRRVKKGYLKY